VIYKSLIKKNYFMKIALIGYGKMGKEIEKIALERNHSISWKITDDNSLDLLQIQLDNTDVAIEFTSPEVAADNILHCINQKVPVVCGTTGWLDQIAKIQQKCIEQKSAFFYASNYSVGVNLFFMLNKILAKIMVQQPDYEVSMEEIHHTEKKDAPSGTAITLANGIIEQYPHKKNWINSPTTDSEYLEIISKREPHVPGTHSVVYNSEVDFIEIKHQAHSRKGFALGAILAAEFLEGKTGVFGMEDLLKL
jgi:4-hydroxy-tetrahydrodipicolinate reductase